MDTIEQNLANWRASLLQNISVAGLYSRNPLVHKWKAPFRCMMIRECVFWRLTDLITQSLVLHRQRHGLGSRILLRSGFETLAILIYLNQLIEQVLAGALNFHVFSEKTCVLLLGSRNGSTEHKSLNIITILEKCEIRYPGVAKLYAELSESAHPNYEGILAGYSNVNRDEYQTDFQNRWMDRHGESHLDLIRLCMDTFHHEYNDVWTSRMDDLEGWIAARSAMLENTKDNPLPA
ncbi:hypothetical protein JNB91_24830 [Rhizobium wenxiniae]|uniref:hypothetical protein n=1 Tax=Rhizobium wenxiniae TaxID=1737357 RepID=UPI001C6F53A7|nr:hypothetical protein [Rhizobium wenxiniae]MBW9091039.1 hypothetical protein [Rhizobium wenxiniae]